MTDPFNDNDPNLSRDVSIHPIALPGRTFSELQIGAKPVMPGNLAPQFENQPAKNPGNRHYEAKTATASSKDPFEDLF